MSKQHREYDIILFGATGYTGKYCAEHVAAHLPTDLKWAIAGRSAGKLSRMLDEIKDWNPDRLQPGLEISSLSLEDLNALVRKTRVLINTVGPYHLYGTAVVEACAKNGTHYLDVTGESPWVLEMIMKYHDIAKANGAIIIPSCGLESAPADLLAFSLATLIREKLSVGTQEVIASVHDLKAVPSGGTLATALGIFDHYKLSQITGSFKNWAMSPVPHPKRSQISTPLLTKLTGVRSVPDLGTLTTPITGRTNTVIVQRSWGLLDKGNLYGPKFQFHEYARVHNAFTGAMMHFALSAGILAFSIYPIRWLLKKLIYQPGDGPTRESTAGDFLEYRVIATADTPEGNKRAMAKMRWKGSMYDMSGTFLAEAAMTILKDEETEAKKLGGGILTPATLGKKFIERLNDVEKCRFEAEIMPY